MEIQPNILLQQKLRRWSKVLIIAVMLVGFIVLLGWQFDVIAFKRPLPNLVAMNPMTALSFLLIGGAFLLITKRTRVKKEFTAGMLMAAIVSIVALLKIVALFAGFDPGIDHWLYNEKIKNDIVGNVSNSMAPNTAACFIFLSVSLLLFNYETSKGRRPSQYLALITGLLGLLSLLGYIYQVKTFYGFLAYIPMAIHTAICFLLFSIAIFFADADKGLMKNFTSVFSGSVMARMLVPAAIIIPIVLGLLRLSGNRAGLYDNEFGIAIYTLSIIIIFLLLIWYNTSLLNKRDLQKKYTENALLDSEEQITAIFENAPDGVVVIGSDGRIIKWNPEAEKLFGWRQEEVINKTLSETILPSEFRETYQKGLQNYLYTGESDIIGKNMDVWALKKDTTDIDISLRISPMMLNNKQFFVGFVRDIRERKKMEAKLESFNKELVKQVDDKTKELKEIFERVTDGFIALDKNFNYTYANKRISQLTHRDPVALIGKNIWNEFPEAMGSSTYHAFNKAMKEQQYVCNTDYFEPLDLWQENHIYPSPEGLSVFIRDISKQKKNEMLLERSEKRFRAIIEQFPYPVVTYERNGDFTTVNKAWETMWQYKREDVKEYNIRKDPQMIASGLSDYIEKAFNGEVAISPAYLYDPKVIGHQAEKKWMVMTLYPLKSESGELLEVILVLQDVTENKNAEEKLKESYEAVRQLTGHLQNVREEERRHIAREIHDELGQLLTVLKMDVSWLDKKIGTVSEAVKEKLSDLLGLIDKTVRTVRKISSELRPTLLDDLGLVAAMEWHLEEFEKRSGIKKQLDLPEAELSIPDSLKIGLFRILQESLTNVARHSGADKVTVNLEQENAQIVLKIEDNGKGFDKNDTPSHTLGVLGMKERTSMMGGKYHIISIPGKGTTVEVIIPVPGAN
ncbi:MAG: PAS domain S-box protein [Chitinophagaceae bacterium]